MSADLQTALTYFIGVLTASLYFALLVGGSYLGYRIAKFIVGNGKKKNDKE